MSDEAKPESDSKTGPVDLTALDFGPSWARGGGGKSGTGQPKRENRKGRPEETQSDSRGRGDKRHRGERRGRDDHRGRGERGGRDDRRGRERGQRRHDGRRGDGRDDRRERRSEAAPPEDVTATVVPVEEGLDRLAREILGGARTYPVFELSKLVLGGRDRFNVSFRCSAGKQLVRCTRDDALWLDRQEAMRHLWRADWLRDFYEEVETEAEPPRGNFQAVARCGISGEYLGPPNYHGYQSAVASLHRERFGHMSLDDYRRKISMERGEEAVRAWLERMSKRVKFRPTGGRPAAAATEPHAADSDEAVESAEGVTDPSATGGEPAPQTEDAGAEEPGPESSEAGEAAEAVEEAVEGAVEGAEVVEEVDPPAGEPETDTAGDPAGELLEDRREVERHFLEHHFGEVFVETDRAWVRGDIPGNRLSPGLLTLLRNTVAEERRYPGKLTPLLCRQLSGRHVAVFKWRKKLKAGPSRPHGIPGDISIADRPRALLEWIQKCSGSSLERLWKDLMPPDADEETKHGWYHDLHWVLNQGYVLLLSDSTLHLARSGESPPAGGRKEPGKRKEPGRPAAKKARARKKSRRRRRRTTGRPGLYAWASVTVAGEPKLLHAMTESGLWPLGIRLDPETEGEQEEAFHEIPHRQWPEID